MSFNLKPFAKRLNNKYLTKPCEKTKQTLSSELETDVERFLRLGGKIETIPCGVSKAKDVLPILISDEVEVAMETLEDDLGLTDLT